MNKPAEQFRTWRNRILEMMAELDETLNHQEGWAGSTDPIQPLRERLLENKFQIIVVGEFSTGKSTFINALLGKDILPAKVRPTTAVLCYISDGEEGALAHYHDGGAVPLTLDELKSFATALDKQGEKEAGLVRHIEVTMPSRLTQDGVHIVDTPGVEDMNRQREEITFEMIPKADAAIMLLDARRVLKKSERRFLEQKLLGNHIQKIFFVVNFIDTVPPENREEILDYTKSNLAQILKLEHAPKVYGVSSKRMLEHRTGGEATAELTGSFQHFEDGLLDFLIEEKGNVLLFNIALRTTFILNELQAHIQMKMEALSIPLQELEEKQERFVHLSGQLRDDKNLLVSEIRAKFKMIPGSMNRDIQDLVRAILQELEEVEFESIKKSEIEAKLKDAVQKRLKSELETTFIPKIMEHCQTISGKTETALHQIYEKIKQFQMKEFALKSAHFVKQEMDTVPFIQYIALAPVLGLLGVGGTLFGTLFVLLFGPITLLIVAVVAVVALIGLSDQLMSLAGNFLRQRIVSNIRKKEPELIEQITRTLEEQLAVYAEQIVHAINQQIDGELTRIQLTLDETVRRKRELETDIEHERARWNEELQRLRDYHNELQGMLQQLNNERKLERLEV